MLLIVKYNALMQCKYRMRTLFFQNGIFAATLFIRSFYTHISHCHLSKIYYCIKKEKQIKIYFCSY